ncbi:MAG: glycosyltransferase [Gaiellaceae bacterium]
MRVCVLTTSYPRDADHVSGVFVADAVRAVRARGVEVEVVSPQDFRHFGIAYGAGIPENIRARPWLVALLPLFLLGFRRAAARAARDADVVHAHWLAAGAIAATLRVPYVVQVWGTDLHLARRLPWLARPILRRAQFVISASRALADEARVLGAREVRVIPSGVDFPASVGAPAEPPHVLYAGRLSPEKGVLELAEAAQDLPLVVVGDGLLRGRFPDAVGFVPPRELGAYYERAAVVAVPSRREGYGVVAREAMAYGRPVVASAVGGLPEAVEDGVSGLLVPPGDIPALREALGRLLADEGLRERLGAAAREQARKRFSHEAAAAALIEAYEAAASGRRRSR